MFQDILSQSSVNVDVGMFLSIISNHQTYMRMYNTSVYLHVQTLYFVYNSLHVYTNFFNCFCSSFALSVVIIDSYPPVTAVEQGESIVLVCRVVGVLPSVTLSYSWACNGRTCEGTEVVSGNRLRIGAISNGLHGGTFTCSVAESGVSVSGTFTFTVTGEEKYSVYLQDISNVCYCHGCTNMVLAIRSLSVSHLSCWYWLYSERLSLSCHVICL